MILCAIGIFILLYSFIDYKKSFLLYLVYQIFWYPGALILNLGNFNITISMTMNLFFSIMYFFNMKKCSHPKVKLPYMVPLIGLIISMFVTCFFAVAGFQSEFTRAISNIIQDILIIFLMWQIVETEEDFKFLFKAFTVVFFVACLYGLYEYIIQRNPLIDLKNTLSTDGIVQYSDTSEAETRGYRISSVFEHPIGAGMTFGLYFVSVYVILIQLNKEISYKWLAIITSLISVVCIIITKMRSGIVFTLLASLAFVNFKKKRLYKLLLVFLAFGIIAFPIFKDNIDLFFSLFNSSAQTAVGGSSVEMRIDQFKAVFELMKMSPIGGLGEKFKLLVNNQYTDAALSYESIWLEQMSKHGMVGVAANLLLAYYSLIRIPKKYHSKECFFLSLAYWITYTLTTVPSFRIYMYYLILFYLIKQSATYKSGQLQKHTIKIRIKNTIN